MMPQRRAISESPRPKPAYRRLSFGAWCPAEEASERTGAGQTYKDFDRLYVPWVGHMTGDLDIHDIAFDGNGRVIFVNTLFSCLATVSDTHSFEPLWRRASAPHRECRSRVNGGCSVHRPRMTANRP
ncbi:MAG: DUF4915 domain-containing protein [Limibaculum sp.]